jgi:DNA-binding GntR family transcriptional regulator
MASRIDQKDEPGWTQKSATEIVHRQLPEIVAESLRESIMRGELRPGAALPMRALAERFGVSVIPVRDALRLLAAEGLVELQPHRGARVVRISQLDLEQIFLARLPLEQLAATKALDTLTAADLRTLRRIQSQMERTRDARRWLELNREFHLDMYQRSGYPRIVRIIEGLWDLVEPYLLLFMRNREAVVNAEAEHRGMIEATEAGDAERLQALVARHLTGTAAQVHRILGEGEDTTAWTRLQLAEKGRAPTSTDGH